MFWELSEDSRASFVLSSRERTIRGGSRVVRGELEVDPADLERTRGTIRVDVGALEVEEEGARGPAAPNTEASSATADASADAVTPSASGAPHDFVDRGASETARSWLNLGASRPQSDRERRRWAVYRITSVVRAGARVAADGRRTPANPADGGPAEAERREVELVVDGTLELQGVRVARRAELVLGFHFPGPARDAVPPNRLELRTKRPFPISLADHEIVPRDSRGTLIAGDLRRFGKEVGGEARVSVTLVARPRPAPTR
jgi:hypothetical protein